MYSSINPATEECLENFKTLSDRDVEEKICKSKHAFNVWRNYSVLERLNVVKKLLPLILEKREEIACSITSEMGKTIRDSYVEVERLKHYCEFAIDHAERILAPFDLIGPIPKTKVSFAPFGGILCITPWNVPVATPFRCILPAVLGGNACLLKPAPNVARSGLFVEKLFLEAGFPEGLVQTLLIDTTQAEKLIEHEWVRKISFTGSSETGSHLASIAGKNIKPIVLELGGSDPFLVLSDADVAVAARDAAGSRCFNAGQVCCSPKRIIVHGDIFDSFLKEFLPSMASMRTGDPLDDVTDFGPIARKDIFEKLKHQTQQMKEDGATVLLEGGPCSEKGYFFSPYVFLGGERAHAEEFFGPVVTLFSAPSVEKIIEIANATPYGLGATVYGKDASTLKLVSDSVESGFVYVNTKPTLHPYIPFGGVKRSGFGKECGEAGYREYVYEKPVIFGE